jgi:hypothetical protein
VDTISTAEPDQSYRERLSVPQLAGRAAGAWILRVAAEGTAYEHRTAPRNLARLAAEAGYVEEGHLTRDCSELTGLTPRAFLEETCESCGANHDREASFSGVRRAILTARGLRV